MAKTKVMTQEQAKKIIIQLNNLADAVICTLDDFKAENTETYDKMFDDIRKQIAKAVGL